MAWEEPLKDEGGCKLIEHEPAFKLPTPKTFLHLETRHLESETSSSSSSSLLFMRLELGDTKSLCAWHTSPPRNRFTVLRIGCQLCMAHPYYVEPGSERCSATARGMPRTRVPSPDKKRGFSFFDRETGTEREGSGSLRERQRQSERVECF